MIWRVLLIVALLAAIFFGLRRIWIDWQRKFKADDQQRRVRDLSERQRPDVIDLKRDGDGIYRRGDEDKR